MAIRPYLRHPLQYTIAHASQTRKNLPTSRLCFPRKGVGFPYFPELSRRLIRDTFRVGGSLYRNLAHPKTALAILAVLATMSAALADVGGARRGLAGYDPQPRINPVNVRWKKVWSDEFNGPLQGEAPECYARKAQCYAGGATAAKTTPKDCPESVKENLANLNKCNWSIQAFAYDPNEVIVSNGELVLSARMRYSEGGANDVFFASGAVQSRMFAPLAQTAPTPTPADKPSSDDKKLESAVEQKGGADAPVKATSEPGVPGFKTTYGRFEIRARIPGEAGVWPAFALQPQEETRPWPFDGQMNVLETFPQRPNTPVASLHGGDPQNQLHLFKTIVWKPVKKYYPKKDRSSTFIDDYHVYAVEWDPLEIRFFVDRWQTGAIRQGEMIEHESGKAYPISIPNAAFYVFLGAQVASGKSVTANLRADPAKFTVQKFYVDYVRAYSRCEKGADADCVESTFPTPSSQAQCPNPCEGIGRYDGHGCRMGDVPEGFLGSVWGSKFYFHPDKFGWIFRDLACPGGVTSSVGKGCLAGEVPKGRKGFSANDELGSRYYIEPVCSP